MIRRRIREPFVNALNPALEGCAGATDVGRLRLASVRPVSRGRIVVHDHLRLRAMVLGRKTMADHACRAHACTRQQRDPDPRQAAHFTASRSQTRGAVYGAPRPDEPDAPQFDPRKSRGESRRTSASRGSAASGGARRTSSRTAPFTAEAPPPERRTNGPASTGGVASPVAAPVTRRRNQPPGSDWPRTRRGHRAR